MIALFTYYLPSTSDMKEIVALLHPKGYTFSDSALLYVEIKPTGLRLLSHGVQISPLVPS